MTETDASGAGLAHRVQVLALCAAAMSAAGDPCGDDRVGYAGEGLELQRAGLWQYDTYTGPGVGGGRVAVPHGTRVRGEDSLGSWPCPMMMIDKRVQRTELVGEEENQVREWPSCGASFDHLYGSDSLYYLNQLNVPDNGAPLIGVVCTACSHFRSLSVGIVRGVDLHDDAEQREEA